MADEIGVTLNVSFQSGSGPKVQLNAGTAAEKKFDCSEKRYVHKTIFVTTSEYTLDLTEFTNLRFVAFVNNEPSESNYVRWGYATGTYKNRVYGGGDMDKVGLEPAEQTLYLISNSGTQTLDIMAVST